MAVVTPEAKARKRARDKAYYEARKAHYAALRAASYQRKKAADPLHNRRKYHRHRQRELERKRELRAQNPEIHRGRSKEHYQKNRHAYIERNRRRTAALGRATPPWSDRQAVRSFYELAAHKSGVTGTPHSVDHIVPLHHPLVCGLHCEFNLQVLTAEENQRKANSFVI